MRIKKNVIILIVIIAMLLVSCTDGEITAIIENSTTESQLDIVEIEKPSELNITYNIVDTGQNTLFSDTDIIKSVTEGEAFYGQDGNYIGNQPSYTDNGDKTITDNVTGLIWQQTMDEKMTYDEAFQYAENCDIGGYNDWRVPNIKELFSLIMYTGESGGETASILFIDTAYFDQPIGDVSIGEREIDAQVLSSTQYTGKTMNNNQTVFGVNFIDGRIKGYPLSIKKNGTVPTYYVRLVRGNEEYGINQFVDNGDGTITDQATGLMWQQSDDGITRNWEQSLAYSEALQIEEYDDWRLPNAKELQSIVDYTKSVQFSDSPAIDDLFTLTEIIDENGNKNYGFYWTSTTHMDGKNKNDSAAYVAFGEALGKMNDNILDVHGAGAVRSDPKTGDISDLPTYVGPQGDIRYVYNYVLTVRTIDGEEAISNNETTTENSSVITDNSYNLFAPLSSTTTYLLDMNNEIVNTWNSEYTPGNAVYMSDNGSILRTGVLRGSKDGQYMAGGAGGIVEKITWDNEVSWSFEYATSDVLIHHDIEELPNGNILMIAWETLTKEQAIESGRNPDLLKDNELWPDHIIEVKPNEIGGDIVWEWHLIDHLIQDFDSQKSNYGDISDNPQLVDINYLGLKGPNASGADWTHINSIDYNSQLDQILLSVHGFNEMWIIDHSTTTKEAASHTGGNQGKGGDLLFRWGNPQAYDTGSESDKVFYGQHDAKWIDTNETQYSILVFNNGLGRVGVDLAYSTVDQIDIPHDSEGHYLISDYMTYLPNDISWRYTADIPSDFYSQNISGAQRLDNGNTLICSGISGKFFEIDSNGTIVWEYTNEFSSRTENEQNQENSAVFRITRCQLDISLF